MTSAKTDENATQKKQPKPALPASPKKPVMPPARELAPTDPELLREPALATLLRTAVYAITAFVFTWPLAVWEGVVGATLGAALASLAGRFVSASRIRTPAVIASALLCWGLGLWLADLWVSSSALSSVVGPANALRAGDMLAFGISALSVGLVTRTLSARRRSFAVLEAILIAAAFAQLVVAHRHGAIHRPFELADPILERGGDPTIALLILGGLAAAVLALLFFSERSVLRSVLHLAAAFFLLLLTLVATQFVGVPEPEIDHDVLGGGGASGGGEGSGNPTDDGPEFRDNYDDSNRNTPVAVVLLHDEYSPPGGAYYFREDAFSQYNGRRMVSATMSGVDDDVATGFPAGTPIEVAHAPAVGAYRGVAETTVGLLADHPRPFGLESPIRFMPVNNPSTARFTRTYRVRSAVLTSDLWGLLAIGDPVMVALDVTPDGPTVPADATLQFHAIGRFDDGSSRDLTSAALWVSSDESVLSFEGGESGGGLARTLTPGRIDVLASVHGEFGRAPVIVSASRLVSLQIGPASPGVPANWEGQLTATGTYDDGTTADVTGRVTWSVGDASIATATTSPGELMGRRAGTTTVTARLRGVSASTDFEVRDASLTAITVSPATATMRSGDTQELTASASFSDGTSLDLTDRVAWSSTPEGVMASAPGSLGHATPRGEGTFTITATFEDHSASAVLTVEPVLEHGVGDPSWPPDVIAHYTRGPADARYAELARRIVSDLPDEYRDDPFAQALAITDYLGANGIYSLRSGHARAADPTADFLFGDLTGYCVHFAHAAVYLMRSIGLPSRVATGYMLPEEARRGGSAMLITGQWSHAWPEVYVTGVGWVVIDVAPERALDGTPSVPDEALQQLLAELLRGETPVSFDGSDAPTPFSEWADMIKGPLQMAVFFLIAFVLVLGYGIKGWRQLAPRFGEARARPRLVYRATLDRLASAGIRRTHGESPEAFAARLKTELPGLGSLTAAHVARSFGGTDVAADLQSHARTVRSGLRRRVPLWRRALGALNPYSWLLTR